MHLYHGCGCDDVWYVLVFMGVWELWKVHGSSSKLRNAARVGQSRGLSYLSQNRLALAPAMRRELLEGKPKYPLETDRMHDNSCTHALTTPAFNISSNSPFSWAA